MYAKRIEYLFYTVTILNRNVFEAKICSCKFVLLFDKSNFYQVSVQNKILEESSIFLMKPTELISVVVNYTVHISTGNMFCIWGNN